MTKYDPAIIGLSFTTHYLYFDPVVLCGRERQGMYPIETVS